ncbi:hypothetical protein AUEXF2481DRAFT_467539 [Aureobasidium subglaciale EXF-2481]|uniref:Uncharacterized protein n=1 Tax=Aureobasidium subglaciale (strain EXF-2481) TaxID=1043005 RepID=A0A074Y161_AURSE|nr:uncharacterized protein AUEXF2481DRAFT_467539 [Aureobasidium subglaciale EXF-2481]KEQ91480.1 hypothetical protein AUEXF2481DRAFT_467539 [Aureobasidium subglaciale EXF-2481]
MESSEGRSGPGWQKAYAGPQAMPRAVALSFIAEYPCDALEDSHSARSQPLYLHLPKCVNVQVYGSSNLISCIQMALIHCLSQCKVILTRAIVTSVAQGLKSRFTPGKQDERVEEMSFQQVGSLTILYGLIRRNVIVVLYDIYCLFRQHSVGSYEDV